MRIHPNWRAALKVTGRWGCADPNLQQLTKDSYVIDKQGKKVLRRAGLRTIYQAPEGRLLVGADWSQLELRVIALLSGDPILLEHYERGLDVHTMGAQMLFGKSEVSDSERKLAKILRFGRFYGGQPPKLHKQLAPSFPGLQLSHVEQLCERIDRDHPHIVQWRADQFELGRQLGFVQTAISGRKLRFYLGQVEPTKCVNFPVQGTAADLCNRAVRHVSERIDWRSIQLVAQCHDELLLEGDEGLKDEMITILKDAMEQTIEYAGRTMTFPIDAEFGKVWGRLEAV